MKRDAVAGGRLHRSRRDGENFAKRGRSNQRIVQRFNAGSVKAIVVGQEDALGNGNGLSVAAAARASVALHGTDQ